MSANGDGDGEAAAAGPAGAPGLAGAVSVAEAWIDAVVWGDHGKVWALIGVEGRTELLEVATKRGMDEGLAARLSTDAASPGETSEFLTDLVNGLRSELAGNDLDHITYEIDDAESTPDRAAVKMFVPLHPAFGGTLPIGTVFLAVEGTDWRVARLIPITSK